MNTHECAARHSITPKLMYVHKGRYEWRHRHTYEYEYKYKHKYRYTHKYDRAPKPMQIAT